jgi:hypothetical protein
MAANMLAAGGRMLSQSAAPQVIKQLILRAHCGTTD